MAVTSGKPKILLGVTVSDSWILLDGFPELLVSKGWDVHLVSNPGPRLDSFGQVPGIQIHPISMQRDISPLSDFRSLISWMSLLRALKPDVVSVGTPKAGMLGMLSASLASKSKRVYVLRGLRLETVHGIKRFILKAVEKLTIFCSDEVIAVSESLRVLVISMGLVNSNKVRVIGPGSSNGVKTDEFSKSRFPPAVLNQIRKSLGMSSTIPVVGFVGRLDKDKGLKTLIDAKKELHSKGIIFQLLIVGAVEMDVSDLLPEDIKGSQQIFFAGKVDLSSPYFQLMDLLVLPSFREGFPNVALEAQASGIPVITTFATGAVDSIVDKITGSLVMPGDSHQLADAISDFLLGRTRFNPEECISWSRRFERVVIQKKHIDFYNSLIIREKK